MPIPLKVNTSTGNLEQFLVADALNIDTIEPRSAGHIVIGATLGAGDEVRLGVSGEVVRVMGDLAVDGSSTVTVDETITGVFTANGNVNLGNNSGDTVNLGGGTSDTVNLEADLIVGAGTVGIGNSVSDYLGDLWLIAVNDNGPDNAAYNLAASGTNAGAYSIGVDPSLLDNATATDLMTALDQLDGAISGGAASLQASYAVGNTISVTTANGAIAFSNSSDVTDVLQLSRTFVGAGDALQIEMGSGNEAVTGIGIRLTSGTGATGDMLFINNLGSGDALDVQDGGGSVLQVTGAGALNMTPTSGQNAVITTAGAGIVDINSASTLDVDVASVEIDATGTVGIESSGGEITIGGDAVAQNVNIGTGAAARTINIGNAASTEIQLDAILVDINAGASGFTIDGGAASSIATSAGNLSLDSAAGELSFDDVGNSGITLSQSSDRTLVQTGSGEVLNGVTSLIGGLNALADAIDSSGLLVAEDPIENGVTVTAGDVVAASTTSGRVTQANGNSNTNGRVIGIALNTGTGDAGGNVICRYALIGSRVTDSGATFTAGNALFVPDGTGRPTSTAPSGTGDLVKRVGWAITSTEYVTDAGPSVIL